jgi:hypothetical protein
LSAIVTNNHARLFYLAGFLNELFLDFMYCENCGTENGETAQFCHHCGGLLKKETTPQAQLEKEGTTNPEIPNQLQTNKTLRYQWLCVAIFILAVWLSIEVYPTEKGGLNYYIAIPAIILIKYLWGLGKK